MFQLLLQDSKPRLFQPPGKLPQLSERQQLQECFLEQEEENSPGSSEEEDHQQDQGNFLEGLEGLSLWMGLNSRQPESVSIV